MMKYIFALVLLAAAESAFGGVCVLSINREACPGKEKEAFDPYKGENPTSYNTITEDQQACVNRAKEFSLILRKRIIKKITVTPTHDQAVLPPVSSEEKCDLNFIQRKPR